MATNLVVSDMDLPEMTILVKDHKQWQYGDKKPVPSRPIVSGNSTINTHLSELISEITEPVAAESEGMEVQLSEEALSKINEYNKNLSSGTITNILGGLVSPNMHNSAAHLPRRRIDSNMHNRQGRDNHDKNVFNISDKDLTTGSGNGVRNVVVHEDGLTADNVDNSMKRPKLSDNEDNSGENSDILDNTDDLIDMLTELAEEGEMKRSVDTTKEVILSGSAHHLADCNEDTILY